MSLLIHYFYIVFLIFYYFNFLLNNKKDFIKMLAGTGEFESNIDIEKYENNLDKEEENLVGSNDSFKKYINYSDPSQEVIIIFI